MTNNPTPNDDRRKYIRISKNFIFDYFDLAKPSEKFPASQIKNISLGGLCIVTEKPFSPGSLLGIEIKTPFFSGLSSFEGRVLESHERIHGIVYETRIQFQHLDPDAEKVLKQAILFFERSESEES